MDVALSRNFLSGVALATRTMPMGEFWVTGGAALPLGREAHAVDLLRLVERYVGHPLGGAAGVSLYIIRFCLEAGAADHIACAGPGAPRKRLTPRVQFKRRTPR